MHTIVLTKHMNRSEAGIATTILIVPFLVRITIFAEDNKKLYAKSS
jgi:hypothetical protein